MPGHVPDKYIHHVIVTDDLTLSELFDEIQEIIQQSQHSLTLKVGDAIDTVVIEPKHTLAYMKSLIYNHIRSNNDRRQRERRESPRGEEDLRRVHGERRHE